MSALAIQLIEDAKRTGAKKLDLGRTGLRDELPEQIKELTELEELILSNQVWNQENRKWVESENKGPSNSFTKIPAHIGALAQLQRLYLGGDWKFGNWYLQDISILRNLKQLHTLDLSFNRQINDFSILQNLKQLYHLDLSNNNSNDISSLQNLKQLHHLNLSNNDLNDISSLQNLKQLHHLNLSNNDLNDISSLQNLKQLHTLDLSSNKQINDFSILHNLKQIYTLGLSYNNLSDISSLQNFKQLHTLDLRENNLSDISSLQNLKQLYALDLSSNNLSDISSLQNLKQLQTLDLRSNKITNIFPLINLIKKGISVSFKEYSSNHKINLFECPIITPPLEIVAQGNQAIIHYFEELERETTRPLLEAKLLILGAGGVGKTSFMTKLMNPNAPLPQQNDTTVGISVTQQAKVFPIENQKHILHIWDFGGQDIYHPTHQFFLTKNSIYVLMQDGREQKTDFYFWLQVQELLAENSPLFILQNIKGNSRSVLPIRELKAKFGNIKDYFEVDLSKVREGYRDFEVIEEHLKMTLKTLPHIGELWPETRFKIREDLLQLRAQNYIDLDEYTAICEAHNYTNPQAQKELLLQLHYIGTVLYFDEPFLEDIVITNPQWATDAVYAIMDHTKTHYQKKGQFEWQDLKAVWSDRKYRGMYYSLLKLMHKFELSFELPGNQHTYIAPILLPEDQPSFDWNDSNNLRMEYQYDFMPKGILARLIVRLHNKIKGQLFWKRGIVLEVGQTQALVTEDYTGRKISIAVQGPEAKEVIFMIYTEIDNIHASYHFSDRIQAIKKVPCNCSVCVTRLVPHFYDFQNLIRRKQRGKRTIECDISYEEVEVRGLLEYITPTTLTKQAAMHTIFISYAHEDLAYKNKLEKQFAVQIRKGKVKLWSDQEILAGKEWDDAIITQLEAAHVIFLLWSPDFFASSYIWERELPIIRKHHEEQTAQVIPVLLRTCDWQATDYSNLQAVPLHPDNNRLTPISQWADQDEALQRVVDRVMNTL